MLRDAMNGGVEERREFRAYRTRVVAFTVGLAVAIAACFSVMHRMVTGRLLRTGVDEPWQQLLDTLAHDPFVLAAFHADDAASRDARDLGPRGLDPDRRVLAWVLVDLAGDAPTVVDRYAQEPEGEPHATALLEEIEARGGSIDGVSTRVVGEVAVRVGPFEPRRPVGDARLDGVGESWLARLRPVLDLLDERVLPELEQQAASEDPPEGAGERLAAYLDLYAALRTLVDDVLVPSTLASIGPGSARMPAPLPQLERAFAGSAGADGPPAMPELARVERWAAELKGWLGEVRFERAGRGAVGAVFASPQLALATQLDRRSRALALALTLLAAAMGVLVARRTTRPLGRILAGIARFSGGDLEHRIEVVRGGELATLARDLNRMAEGLAESERARRLASMGLVVGGAAHELKNPVHALRGALELVDRYTRELLETEEGEGVSPERRRELRARVRKLLDGSHDNVGRMERILEEIRVVNRVDSDPRERVDLAAMTREAVEDLRARWEGLVELELRCDGAAELVAAASIVRIPQNLVANAIAAIEEARDAGRAAPGRVRVRVESDPERVRLVVDDDGLGVDPALRERIFDLFFTTREVGRGSGLGLFLVHEIAQAHGGTVRCESPGALGGATFVVELPRSETHR